jgi:hypothetical protein
MINPRFICMVRGQCFQKEPFLYKSMLTDLLYSWPDKGKEKIAEITLLHQTLLG